MAVDWKGIEISDAVADAAFNGVVRGIGLVDQEATRLILDTTKTGRVYRRRGVEHRASAPGEPPASDAGRLIASKTIDTHRDRIAAILTFRTEYASYLEYGTRKMQPRPFARTALANMEGQIEAAIADEVSGVLR